jgi:hypothetical protein
MKRLERDELEYQLEPETTRQYYQAHFAGIVIYIRSLPDDTWGWHINQYGVITHQNHDPQTSMKDAYLEALRVVKRSLLHNLELINEELETTDAHTG